MSLSIAVVDCGFLLFFKIMDFGQLIKGLTYPQM